MNTNEYYVYTYDCNGCGTCDVCVDEQMESEYEIMMDDIWGIINDVE
jgi:Ni,Fe-hydrogenase III small subunit